MFSKSPLVVLPALLAAASAFNGAAVNLLAPREGAKSADPTTAPAAATGIGSIKTASLNDECLQGVMSLGLTAPTPPPELVGVIAAHGATASSGADAACGWISDVPGFLEDEVADWQGSVAAWASDHSSELRELGTACVNGEAAVCTDALLGDREPPSEEEAESGSVVVTAETAAYQVLLTGVIAAVVALL